MFLLTDADVEFLLDLGRRWNALIFLVPGSPRACGACISWAASRCASRGTSWRSRRTKSGAIGNTSCVGAAVAASLTRAGGTWDEQRTHRPLAAQPAPVVLRLRGARWPPLPVPQQCHRARLPA